MFGMETFWMYMALFVIIVLFILFLRYYNIRRIECVRKFFLCIGWDKFARLDLCFTVHKAQIGMSDRNDNRKFLVTIDSGGRDYWTEASKTGEWEECFDLAIAQVEILF